MKRLLCVLLMVFAGLANASGFNFDLKGVPLPQVLAIVYGDSLKEPFVIDEKVQSVPITFSVKDVSPGNLRTVFDDYLLSRGIKRVVSGGINLFVPADSSVRSGQGEPARGEMADEKSLPDKSLSAKAINRPKESQTMVVYKPKARTAEDLYRVVAPLLGGRSMVAQAADGPDAAGSAPVGGQGGAYLDQVLLIGDRSRVALAREVLERFDVPSEMVLVRASVVEYAASEDSGAGFAGAVKALGGRLNVAVGSAPLANFVRFSSSSFDAVVSAISQDSNFGILDTASLRVATGKNGVLNVGQEVPTLGAVTLDQQGRQVQSVNYRQSGLSLSVKPVVLGEVVHAEVHQTVSSFAVTTTSTINSPTLLKRDLATSLVSGFGEVILLGGLDESKDSAAASGLFGLNFSKSKAKSRSTVFVVLEFTKV